jgi:hypothetical protein
LHIFFEIQTLDEYIAYNKSTNNKTINHFSPQFIGHKKTKTFDHGNAFHGLGQAQPYGGIKPVKYVFWGE